MKIDEKFENQSIVANFLPLFMNLNHVLKKVGKGRSGDLFLI
jgi:hypothetical protein